MKTSLQDRIIISPEVLFQDASGETVLLDLRSETYYGLDAVGTRIWALLQEHGCLGEVYHALQCEYEVDPEQLATDLLGHVDELLRAGLLKLEREDDEAAS
jgi:hypothetical protein